MLVRFVFTSLLLSIFFSNSLHAAEAPDCKKAMRGAVETAKFAFLRHENDSRCEGLLAQPKSAGELSLRSVSRDNLKRTKSDVIYVNVPAYKSNDQAIELVSRRLLKGRPYYQMLTTILPNQSFQWTMGTVLSPLSIQVDTLGILARVTGKNEIELPVYLPATVSSTPIDRETEELPIIIKFQTSVILNEIAVYEWCDNVEKKVPTSATSASRDAIILAKLSEPCLGTGRVIVSVTSSSNQGAAIQPLDFHVPR